MCGIAGFFGDETDSLDRAARSMTSVLRHRGPDDEGHWLDRELQLALGHRRLSILDLSPEGHQPMVSASGRFVLVFNGEVYNFRELSAALSRHGHRFRGTSDTEVMLAAFEEWGVRAAVPRFNGMFACAVWDRKECALYLFRDRVGKKPLYYGWNGRGLFLFASELKALRRHPNARLEVEREAVAGLMRFGYIPGPYSIYRGIYKLPPGSLLQLTLVDLRSGGGNHSPHMSSSTGIRPEAYWSARGVIESALANPFKGSESDALAQFDELLRDAVRLRMVADVPVGAFLSGGIDSSLTVACMQALSSIPVRTFSIGFHEDEYNEAHWAKEVARHLRTDHTELYLTAAEALAVIPRLPEMFDEPFADPSQIPTFLVSELARRHVTVSLSGDGGDELFAGYNRYVWAKQIWAVLGKLPLPLRRGAAQVLGGVPIALYDRLFALARPLRPASLHFHNAGQKIHKLAAVLATSDHGSLYRRLVGHWPEEEGSIVLGTGRPDAIHDRREEWPSGMSHLQQMMFLDLMSYLPDDILVKVDRASMAVSLEARAPLLDYRLVEFAWRLPAALKLKNGKTKYLMRQLLYRYVPQSLIERPKMGFGVPIDHWLRGPLREWAEDLLSEQRLRNEGYLRPEPIRTKWLEHLSGKNDWHYYLWDVLMFQAWLGANSG